MGACRCLIFSTSNDLLTGEAFVLSLLSDVNFVSRDYLPNVNGLRKSLEFVIGLIEMYSSLLEENFEILKSPRAEIHFSLLPCGNENLRFLHDG